MEHDSHKNGQHRKPWWARVLQGRYSRIALIVVLLLASGIWIWLQVQRTTSRQVTLHYSAFRHEVRAGNVREVTVSGSRIQGLLKNPQALADRGERPDHDEFITYIPSFGDQGLLDLLESEGVQVITTADDSAAARNALLGVVPATLLLSGALYLMFGVNRTGRSLFTVGRSRARVFDNSTSSVGFDDVAGAATAKAELQEIIAFLRDPAHFQRLGGQIPKGVLLVGPPGTGKTLLARAVAGEAHAPFFSISGSDFMEMFVGVGASRVRDLFREAAKSAPSIIFIDELDSIGQRREASQSGAQDERAQTLNQLLSEMDGFERAESVIVIGATNRPDVLDPALLRPGRFDRRVTVDLPSLSDRLEILKVHSRHKPLAPSVDLEAYARGTSGFSGADLENLLNEAALLAARKNKSVIECNDLEDARDKVMMGLARENLGLTPEDLRVLSYHEAGHAVVAVVLPHTDPVYKVTVVPRGHAMGVTQMMPEREKYVHTREYVLDMMAMMMGGRAAEELVLGTATTGAEKDLKEATRLARKMVLDWGMGPTLGNVAMGGVQRHMYLGDGHSTREYSEATAREIDDEVRAILASSYERAVDALREHRDGLDAVAQALLDNEQITGEEVLRLVRECDDCDMKQRSGLESPVQGAGLVLGPEPDNEMRSGAA